jgi:hypothetical protein
MIPNDSAKVLTSLWSVSTSPRLLAVMRGEAWGGVRKTGIAYIEKSVSALLVAKAFLYSPPNNIGSKILGTMKLEQECSLSYRVCDGGSL